MLPALVILVLGIGGLLAASFFVGRRGLGPTADIDFGTWSGLLAAGLSLGAAATHFAVIGEHFAAYPPYGVAFAALAWFQVGWAVAYVARRRRGLALAAIAVNAGALSVWVVSRAFGLPVGPHPGGIEPVGPLDLVASGLELALIVVLAWNLAAVSARFRPRLSASSAVASFGSVCLAIVVVTSAAFAESGALLGRVDHGHAASEQPKASEQPETTVQPLVQATPAASANPSAPVQPSAVASSVASGTVRFGTAFDLAGQIVEAKSRFREGETAVWRANLAKPPAAPTVRFVIVQVLPDGREFEHWTQEIAVPDPGGHELVGMAELSIYVHGGEGSYRMRYYRGDELLAEGAFEFVP